jgi:hypothetical protein
VARGFGGEKMVRVGNRVLAAIVGLCARNTLAFHTTFHRLRRTGIGEAVERASQQHDCPKADDDLNAALHL